MKKREHLDALRPQALLLVQVFAYRAADHLALHRERIHIAPRLAGFEELLAARHA